jgi:hypothetical protein
MVCAKHGIQKIWQKNGNRRRRYCPRCHAENSAKYYAADPRRRLLDKAKVRAKECKVPFTLVLDDIVIPTHCPVLGIRLELGTRIVHDASPTIDRLKPELGYVPSNIAVISNRANMIKSVGSAEEHEKLAAWMRQNDGIIHS